MVVSFPFAWRRGVEEFLCQFLAFLCELPAPAWTFPDADSVPVDAVCVSVAFEFHHAASQALRRVMEAERLGHCRQVLLCDWTFEQAEEHDYMPLSDVVH